jgi:hypothetical protein
MICPGRHRIDIPLVECWKRRIGQVSCQSGFIMPGRQNGVDQMMSRGVAAGDISTCEMAISRPVK